MTPVYGVWTHIAQQQPPRDGCTIFLGFGPKMGQDNMDLCVLDHFGDVWNEGGTEMADHDGQMLTHWMPLPAADDTVSAEVRRPPLGVRVLMFGRRCGERTLRPGELGVGILMRRPGAMNTQADPASSVESWALLPAPPEQP